MHFWKKFHLYINISISRKSKTDSEVVKKYFRDLLKFYRLIVWFLCRIDSTFNGDSNLKKNDIKSGVSVIFTLKAVWEFRESRIGPQYTCKVRSNEKYFQSWLQKPCLKWHAIDPSLLKGCQAKARYFSPLPEKVRFPYDWNIFDNNERTKV